MYDKKIDLIFALLFYKNIFAKITIYLNLQSIDELQKKVDEKYNKAMFR